MTAAMTGSAAMLAETFHSIADTGSQILLFLGMRLSQRPPDRNHPFGYGMNTYFWAFVVSAMLFTVGGVFDLGSGPQAQAAGDGRGLAGGAAVDHRGGDRSRSRPV